MKPNQPALARLVILCLFVMGITSILAAVWLSTQGKAMESIILALFGIGNNVTIGLCALLASTKDTTEGQINAGTGIQTDTVNITPDAVNAPQKPTE